MEAVKLKPATLLLSTIYPYIFYPFKKIPKLAESKCRGLHHPVIATSHTKEFAPNNLHIYFKEPSSCKYNPFLHVSKQDNIII